MLAKDSTPRLRLTIGLRKIDGPGRSPTSITPSRLSCSQSQLPLVGMNGTVIMVKKAMLDCCPTLAARRLF